MVGGVCGGWCLLCRMKNMKVRQAEQPLHSGVESVPSSAAEFIWSGKPAESG